MCVFPMEKGGIFPASHVLGSVSDILIAVSESYLIWPDREPVLPMSLQI